MSTTLNYNILLEYINDKIRTNPNITKNELYNNVMEHFNISDIDFDIAKDIDNHFYDIKDRSIFLRSYFYFPYENETVHLSNGEGFITVTRCGIFTFNADVVYNDDNNDDNDDNN